MSWYKKYKVVVKDQSHVQKFKLPGDYDLQISPSVSDVATQNNIPIEPNEIDVDKSKQDGLLLKETLLQQALNFISAKKVENDQIPFSSDEDLNVAQDNLTRQIADFVRKMNKQIEKFNIEHPGQRVEIISWRDLGVEGPSAGVMRSLLLPFSGTAGKKVGEEDLNAPAIINYIQSVFSSNGITNDESGAKTLADFASSDEHPEVRSLINEYFGKSGRQNFNNL